MEQANAAGDADALDRALDELAVLWARSPRGLEALEASRVASLMLRERYDEAVAIGRRSLEKPHSRKQEAALLNNLAWALAHTGELNEAAEVGERALAAASGTRIRSFANGTLGAVYVLKGEAVRALRHLDEAMALEHGGAAIEAARQYYCGVALESLGRIGDAIRAYESACAAAAVTPHGRKAAARLADLQSGT